MIDFNSMEEVTNKLNELKAKNLPHVTIKSFRKINKSFDEKIDYATDEERAEIEEYFSAFYDDSDEDSKIHGCIFSEEQPILSWGLAHGVMCDSNTGLDWKAYHYLTINGKRSKYDRILQYHPDGYNIND